MMKYKGYTGHVEYDDEAKIFHGEEPYRLLFSYPSLPSIPYFNSVLNPHSHWLILPRILQQ
jgi:hypothetical protein